MSPGGPQASHRGAAGRVPIPRHPVQAALIAVSIACLGFSAQAAPACGWRPGEVLELQGVVSRGGLSGPFHRWVQLGAGRWRETDDFGAIATAAGYDGRLGWSQDASGASHDLDSGFARALSRSEAWLAGRPACPTAGAAGRARGRQAAGGRALEVREITPPGGAPVEVWTDLATGRPDREVLQYAENRIVRHLDQWRDIGGGRWVAFRQDDEDPEDGETTSYRVTTARLGAPPAAGFGAPPQPHDVQMLGGQTSTTVPYEDDDRTRVYLPVYLDGKGPFLFELDNGGHFILSEATAGALNLQARGAFASSGAGVEVKHTGFATVGELRIGEAVVRGQPVRVRPLPAAANERGPRPARAGILGMELFERFTVAIDRTAHAVTLTPRGAPYPKPRGVALPIVFAEDAPLTPGALDGVRGDFMLDIGNAGSTIVEQVWAEPRGLAERFRTAPRLGDAAFARGLVRLGPFRLPGELLSYYGRVPLGSESTHAVAAVLGEPLLSRFDTVYDVARKTLWLSPAPGVGLKPFNRAGLFLARAAGGGFKVQAVWPGSPAEAAGLTPGQAVSAVDGQPAAGLSRADVARILEQPSGTRVRLTLAGPDGAPREVSLCLKDVL